MLRFVNWLLGLLVGALVGAGLVLLFAERSGAETQELLRNRLQAIREEGRQAAQNRRLELTAELEALKRPGKIG